MKTGGAGAFHPFFICTGMATFIVNLEVLWLNIGKS
jgi:hypothetical protein